MKAGNLAMDDIAGVAATKNRLLDLLGDDTSHHSFMRNYYAGGEGPESVYHACVRTKLNMIKETEHAIGSYLSPSNSLETKSAELWWWLGAVLHTLEDSFCPAHATRNEQTGLLTDICSSSGWEPGDYGQSGCSHDSLLWFLGISGLDADDLSWLHPGWYQSAQDRTIEFLTIINDFHRGLWTEKETKAKYREFFDTWFNCRHFVDADGDGYTTEDNHESPTKSHDCNDQSADIHSCGGDCTSDFDQDGIPDKCDPCPNVRDVFFMANAPAASVSPAGFDTDLDGIADECELCPDTANHVFKGFVDVDGDGVHDKCDNCLATKNPVLACVPGGDPCPETHGPNVCIPGSVFVRFGRCADTGASCSYCWSPGVPWGTERCPWSPQCNCEEVGEWGRCSRQGNRDGDLRGDACDNCPDYASEDYRNSNKYAENWIAGLEELEDICDAVPVFRFAQSQTSHYTDHIPVSDSRYWHYEDFHGASWLGYDKQNPATVDSSNNERIAFRHCSCYGLFDGVELPASECAQLGGQCSPLEMGSNSSPRWKIPSIRYYFQAGQTLIAQDVSAEGRGNRLFSTLTETQSTIGTPPYEWAWRQDAEQGTVTTKTVNGQLGTHGMLGAFVPKSAKTYSLRDGGNELRETMELYHTPSVRYKPPGPPVNDVWDLTCSTGGCWLWVDPIDRRQIQITPDPIPWLELRQPGILDWQDGTVVYRNPEVAWDASAAVSAGLKEALQSTSPRTWLKPSEPGNVLSTRGIARQAIGLPSAAADGTQPVTVLLDGDILQLSTERESPIGGLYSMTASMAMSTALRLPTGGSAVYSALDEAVYFAGGTLNGLPNEAILRLDLGNGTLAPVAALAPFQPGKEVISTAYDAVRGVLYVLDKVSPKPGKPHPHRARLLAFDLTRSDASTLLSELPHHGVYSVVHLAVDGDGTLLLIGETHHQYKVWRIETGPHHAKFKGVRVGNGTILDRPFQGERGPLLPVVANGKLSLQELAARTFAPGEPCNDL
jgi:hypothetical protein